MNEKMDHFFRNNNINEKNVKLCNDGQVFFSSFAHTSFHRHHHHHRHKELKKKEKQTLTHIKPNYITQFLYKTKNISKKKMILVVLHL